VQATRSERRRGLSRRWASSESISHTCHGTVTNESRTQGRGGGGGEGKKKLEYLSHTIPPISFSLTHTHTRSCFLSLLLSLSLSHALLSRSRVHAHAFSLSHTWHRLWNSDDLQAPYIAVSVTKKNYILVLFYRSDLTISGACSLLLPFIVENQEFFIKRRVAIRSKALPQ